MPFTVVLPPDIIARAYATEQDRPKNIKHHKPAAHPQGELSGALSEHAWAYHYKINPNAVDSSGGEFGHGDGGKDFIMHGLKVDIKSSPVHPWSWLVGRGDLKADWYVFAFVILPGTVIFRAKAPGWFLKPFGVDLKIGKRRVGYEELNPEWRDLSPDDFTKTGVKRLKAIREGFHR